MRYVSVVMATLWGLPLLRIAVTAPNVSDGDWKKPLTWRIGAPTYCIAPPLAAKKAKTYNERKGQLTQGIAAPAVLTRLRFRHKG